MFQVLPAGLQTSAEEVASLRGSLGQLQQDLIAARSDAALASRIADQLHQARADINSLQADLTAARSSLKAVESTEVTTDAQEAPSTPGGRPKSADFTGSSPEGTKVNVLEKYVRRLEAMNEQLQSQLSSHQAEANGHGPKQASGQESGSSAPSLQISGTGADAAALEKQLLEAQATIEELQDKLARDGVASGHKTRLRQEANNARQQASALQQSLHDHQQQTQAQKSRLEGEIQELREGLATAEANARDLQSNMEALQRSLEAKQQQAVLLQEQIATAAQQSQLKLKQDADGLKLANDELTSKLQAAQQAEAKIQQQLAEQDARSQSIQQQQLEHQATDHSELQAKLQAAQQVEVKLQQQVTELNAELSTLQQRLDDHSADHDEMLQNLQEQLEAASKQLEGQQPSDTDQSAILEMRDELQAVSTELARLQRLQPEHIHRQQSLQEQLLQVQGELHDAEGQVSRLTEQLSLLQGQHGKSSKDADAAKAKADSLQHNLSDLKQAAQEVRPEPCSLETSFFCSCSDTNCRMCLGVLLSSPCKQLLQGSLQYWYKARRLPFSPHRSQVSTSACEHQCSISFVQPA